MNPLTKLKVISATLSILLVIPLWFYVLYSILDMIHAPTHVWFAFWIYVPVTMLVSVIVQIISFPSK